MVSIEKLRNMLKKIPILLQKIKQFIAKIIKKLWKTAKEIIKFLFLFIFPIKETRNSKGLLDLTLTISLLFFAYRFTYLHTLKEFIANACSFGTLFTMLITFILLNNKK